MQYKIINTIEGDNYQQIIEIVGIDLIRGVVQVKKQRSKYNESVEEIQILNLSDEDKDRIMRIVTGSYLKNMPGFVPLEEFQDWLFPDKAKRIFVSNDQIAWFTANAKEFIDQIYANNNPFVKINGVFEIYMNELDPNVIPILEKLCIEVQIRP